MDDYDDDDVLLDDVLICKLLYQKVSFYGNFHNVARSPIEMYQATMSPYRAAT